MQIQVPEVNIITMLVKTINLVKEVNITMVVKIINMEVGSSSSVLIGRTQLK